MCCHLQEVQGTLYIFAYNAIIENCVICKCKFILKIGDFFYFLVVQINFAVERGMKF